MDKEHRTLMAIKVKHQLLLLFIAGVTAFFLVQLTTIVIGPRFEGRLFPVIGQVEITDVEESKCEDCVSISGRFEKLRECTFIDLLVVYQVPNRGHVGVPVRFTNGPIVRGEGAHHFGPWEIDLSVRQFEENTIIEAFHQCHPFWVTVTRFHPPR